MDLFHPMNDSTPNLLPYDGTVHYHGAVLPASKATQYFQALDQGLTWLQDEVVVYGKRHITQRRTAWHGDNPIAYTYSQQTRQALPWTPELQILKQKAEQYAGQTFNACLLNRYADGSQGMGWHADDEASIVPLSPIASLSLGATRRFDLKHRRTGHKVQVVLEHGSLLVMAGETQLHWLHSLPKALRVREARINLTFRMMREAK